MSEKRVAEKPLAESEVPENGLTTVLIPGFMLEREMWSDIEAGLQSLGPVLHSDPNRGVSIEDMAALACSWRRCAST